MRLFRVWMVSRGPWPQGIGGGFNEAPSVISKLCVV